MSKALLIAGGISIALFWLVRAVAQILYFRIGVDGSWVGVLIFGAIGFLYLIPLLLIKPTQVATQ
jgi:membrane protein YdbS with pleckstrin-like domain